MLTVHHLGISQSERIVWLCEELAIPYQLKCYARDPVTKLAPAAYKALHPVGTAPVISDGDLVLSESGAIIEYIIAKHGSGRLAHGPSHPDYAAYVFWMHFTNGSMMSNEMGVFVANGIDANSTSPVAQLLKTRSDQAYAFVEQRLGEMPYFAGREFTAADINMNFPLTTMRAFSPRDLGPFPNIRAYLKRIAERPAYQAARAKGDPDFPAMLS
jgi:glutathione S-transferase